jgi:hypothetical protein
LAQTDLLVLDDFGATPLSDEHRRDLLEILEDRYDVLSTLVTSQYPLGNWHELIGDPTLADAILDRLLHNSYKIKLKGESMRKRREKLTQTEQDRRPHNPIPASLRSDSCPLCTGTVVQFPPESLSSFTGMRSSEEFKITASAFPGSN